MLSGLGVDRDATESPIPHWRRAKGRGDDFIRTMPQAFADLEDSERLRPTIICPGALHDDEQQPTGVRLVEPDGKNQDEPRTSRANVAATLVACLDEPATVGQTIGVVDGDTPAADSLRGWSS